DSERSGALLDRDTSLLEMGLQFAGLEHLAHDVGAADEFALHIELGNGRPVGIGLDAFAQLFALEHNGAAIFNAEVVQDLDNLARKSAVRQIRRAINEQELVVVLLLVVDEGVDIGHGSEPFAKSGCKVRLKLALK